MIFNLINYINIFNNLIFEIINKINVLKFKYIYKLIYINNYIYIILNT